MGKQMRVKRGDEFDYRIVWEDSFDSLADEIGKLSLSCEKIAVITDSNVGPLYADAVAAALAALPGARVDVHTFPAGETSKNLDSIRDIYRFLIGRHYTRKDLIVALGGGVCGDMAGFAAATYLRGIDYIQIPTSLLAQVDASVGGKTGVDFDCYKNMVGAFYQPRLVYMNMKTLATLPDVQFASGMAEVLKSGLIRDADFYEWTINHMGEIEERIPAVLAKCVKKCCEIKAAVVESDPKETGERAVLNFGHTIGHAIEKLKNFELTHGACVALGTIAAAHISFKRGYLSLEEFYEIRDMYVGFDLPIFFGGLTADDIIAATKSDKKRQGSRLRFILLEKIGRAVIDETVTEEEMREAINFINGDLIDGE